MAQSWTPRRRLHRQGSRRRLYMPASSDARSHSWRSTGTAGRRSFGTVQTCPQLSQRKKFARAPRLVASTRPPASCWQLGHEGATIRDLLDLPNWTVRRVCRDAEHLAATVASVVVRDSVRAEELQPAWLKPAAPRTDKKEHSPSQYDPAPAKPGSISGQIAPRTRNMRGRNQEASSRMKKEQKLCP